jgi:hypothetical protein
LLALVLIVKRAWRTAPTFTAYAIFNLLQIVVGYTLRNNVTAYFWIYWGCEAITVGLGLAVVYEIFRKILLTHAALERLAWLMFLISAAALLVLGVAVIWMQLPFSQKSIPSAVFAVEEAARILEVGTILFLFVFATAFGLHWRHTTFGITLGLGIFTAVELVALAVRGSLGASGLATLNLIRMLAFDLSLLVWTGYFLAPEPATTGELPKREQLEQWNRAVMEFMHQ